MKRRGGVASPHSDLAPPSLQRSCCIPTVVPTPVPPSQPRTIYPKEYIKETKKELELFVKFCL